MNNVYCAIDECKYNCGRSCRRKLIYLNWKPSNEFQCGERVYYPVCEDFEEMEDNEDGRD